MIKTWYGDHVAKAISMLAHHGRDDKSRIYEYKEYRQYIHLTLQLGDDGHLSIILGKSLISHIQGSASRGDEDVVFVGTKTRLKSDVVDVRMEPAISLSEHRLGSESRGHHENRLGSDCGCRAEGR